MRKIIIAAASALAVLGVAAAAPAAGSKSVGSAETSLTLASVQAGQAVDLLVGSGLATTDPARKSLSSLFASVQLAAARLGSNRIGETAATADADGASPAPTADGQGGFTLPVQQPPLLDATASVVAKEARVDEAAVSALGRLAGVSLDADVLQGLLVIDRAALDLVQESGAGGASAIQGVSLRSLEVLPLGRVLDLLTTLSPDSLVALADGVAPGTGDAVKTAKASLIALTNSVINGLGLPSVPLLSEPITIEALISTVDGLAATVPLLAGVTQPLKDALAALRQLIGRISLLSIDNLRAGVRAEALDASSSAAADAVAWDAISVAGVALPSSATVDAALEAVRAKVNEVVGVLRAVPGLAGLNVAVDLGARTEKTSVDGAYRVAEAGITGLTVKVALPAAAGIVAPLSVNAQVLSLTARAEHAAAGTLPGGTLPATGTDDLPLLALGLLLVVAGFTATRRKPARI